VSATVADPALQARRQPLLPRALAGVTPAKLGVVALLVFLGGMFLSIDGLGGALHEGGLLPWFAVHVVREFLFNFASVALALLPVVVVGNLGPQQGWRRYAALALAVLLLAAPIAGVLRFVYTTLVYDVPAGSVTYGGLAIRFYSRYVQWTGAVTAVGEFYRHAMRSIEAMRQAELDRVSLEEQMAEARMQVLQAQIEPHFLFNTLASVRRLYQLDAGRGRTMLENLMRYFEVALPRMREGHSTLAREISLIEAYLNVQKIRMADRLAYEIDLPDSLREAAMPPMMLLTLVENAIKHGLGPLPEGGHLSVRARRAEDQLQVEVADTGRGLQPGAGAGTGLANTRARLASLFGGEASLALVPNEPRGIRASIALPLGAAT
jgi:signal transduction histidine kinase